MDEDSCFFLYGTLKPGQYAHHRIAGLIDTDRTTDAELSDFYLLIRDSLPFAYSSKTRRPDDGNLSPIKGSIVFPKVGERENLEKVIYDYEDPKLYKRELCTVSTSDGNNVVAILYSALKATNRRGLEIANGEWQVTDDPILRYGLPRLINEIEEMDLKDTNKKFPADMHNDYWSLMWRIQGAYANLMTVTECFCRLNFGTTSKNQYYRELDSLWTADEKLSSTSLPKVHVHNAKEASDTELYSTEKRPFMTYYQVRNNMVHSGKEGYLDLEIIKHATTGLAIALPKTIVSVVPQFENLWKMTQN